MAEAPAGSLLQRLVSYGGIYALARFANQGAAFLLVPLYAHVLGGEGTGIVEITGAVRNALVFVLLQGLHSAWLRLRDDADSEPERKRYETTITWYLLLSSIGLFGVASVVAAPIWNALIPTVPYAPFGALSFIAAAGAAMSTLAERKLQSEHRATTFATATLVRTITMLGTIVLFVVGLRRGALGKVEAEAVAAVMSAAWAFFLIRPGPLRDFSVPDIKRSLSYGWPLIPQGIAGLINDAIDRFMVSSMMSMAAAGVYSLGYRIASISMILMMAVNQALAPLFIESMRRIEAEQDVDKANAERDELARLGLVTLALAVIVVQCVTAFGPEVLAVFGTAEFAESWRVLAPVGGGALAWVCYAVFSQSITYRRQSVRYLPWITAVAAAINVVANWLLIPSLGIQGAAWATLISNCALACGALYIGQRSVKLPYAWSRWAGLIALTGFGLALLVVVETHFVLLPVRVLAKLAWLAIMLALAVKLAGVRMNELRPPRKAARAS